MFSCIHISGMFIAIERVFEYESGVEREGRGVGWEEWSEPSIFEGRVYAFDTAIMHANLMALRIMDLNLCQISYAHPSFHLSTRRWQEIQK